MAIVFKPSSCVLVFFIAFVAGPAQGQSYKILQTFNGTNGANPDATPVFDAAGNLYGTAPNGGQCATCGLIYKLDSIGNMTTLYSFSETGTDGRHPYAPVIFDSDGNLYGTTIRGGDFGWGTVFKLDKAGNITTLHSFEQEAFVETPTGGLYRGRAGSLFGVTTHGGLFNFGVIFKIAPDGHYSVLHDFAGPPDDGADPIGRLVRDSDLNFYGTASHGGKNDSGILFKLDAAGNYSVLHHFTGAEVGEGAGAFPQGTLLARGAELFGTTWEGGKGFPACQAPTPNEFQGCGVVYKLNKDGTNFGTRSLNLSTGRNPYAGLVPDAAGNLYGTTYLGGPAGYGTVFKMDKNGRFTTLHVFTSENGDGADPSSPVVMDAAGNIFGTTRWGGRLGRGVIYKITP